MTKRSTHRTRQRASKGVDILKKHLQKLSLFDSTSNTESEGECTMCGLVYGKDDDDGSTWIQCDACKTWWDLPCTGVSESDIPDFFSCPNCIS